jgi:hypothetical protein
MIYDFLQTLLRINSQIPLLPKLKDPAERPEHVDFNEALASELYKSLLSRGPIG